MAMSLLDLSGESRLFHTGMWIVTYILVNMKISEKPNQDLRLSKDSNSQGAETPFSYISPQTMAIESDFQDLEGKDEGCGVFPQMTI